MRSALQNVRECPCQTLQSFLVHKHHQKQPGEEIFIYSMFQRFQSPLSLGSVFLDPGEVKHHGSWRVWQRTAFTNNKQKNEERTRDQIQASKTHPSVMVDPDCQLDAVN